MKLIEWDEKRKILGVVSRYVIVLDQEGLDISKA